MDQVINIDNIPPRTLAIQQELHAANQERAFAIDVMSKYKYRLIAITLIPVFYYFLEFFKTTQEYDATITILALWGISLGLLFLYYVTCKNMVVVSQMICFIFLLLAPTTIMAMGTIIPVVTIKYQALSATMILALGAYTFVKKNHDVSNVWWAILYYLVSTLLAANYIYIACNGFTNMTHIHVCMAIGCALLARFMVLETNNIIYYYQETDCLTGGMKLQMDILSAVLHVYIWVYMALYREH
jgi:hypothetical protein